MGRGVANVGVGADIDLQSALTIEQAENPGANLILEGGGVEVLGLRLAGQDQPRRIGDRGLEHLTGEEYERGLDDREQQREEREHDDAEFDQRRAVVAAHELARQRAGEPAGPGRGEDMRDCPAHCDPCHSEAIRGASSKIRPMRTDFF